MNYSKPILAGSLLISTFAPLYAQDDATEGQIPPAAADSTPAPSTEATKAPAAQGPTTAKRTERIQVTGSRIKRVDAEGTTQVQTIDKKAIERSGAANLSELLQRSTAAPTGNFTGDGGLTIRAGAATVDLLGLGADRTLVLLNGKRLPVESSLGAVNVANIPVSAIERIDILSGGASAVYGADAIGGVMNIITRTDFEGVEASVRASVPQHGGGESLEVGAVGGGRLGDATGALIYSGYRSARALLLNNRDVKFSRPGREYTLSNPPQGGFSYRPIDNYGTPTEDYGNFSPSSNCPTGNQIATVPSEPNIYCAGLRKEMPEYATPRSKEFYLLARVEHEVSDVTKVSLSGLFNQKSSFINNGNYLLRTDDPITGRGILLSQARAEQLGISGLQPGQAVEIFARSDDMADRESYTQDSVLGSTLQLETSWNNWDIDTSFSYFTARNTMRLTHVLNKELEINLLHNRTNPLDPAYIPIDPNRNPALLAGIYNDLESSEVTRNSILDVSASRDLFAIPGGTVRGSLGAAYTTEAYKQVPDVRDQQFYRDTNGQPEAADGSNVTAIEPLYTGVNGVSGKGSRNVGSFFGELVVPATKEVEVDLALRLDNFSDFGTTTNYSLGSKYKVAENLLLRANAASAFKAPRLNMIHNEGGGGYVSVTDERWCTREREQRNGVCEPGSAHQIYTDSPGNKDLKEEKGISYSFGAVYDPLSVLGLSADYHIVQLKGSQNVDDSQKILDRYYAGENMGKNIAVVDGDGIVSSLRLPYQNSGRLLVQAADLKANYSQLLGPVRLGYDASYFRYYSYKVKDYKDSPNRQQLGYKGIPKWKTSSTVSLSLPDNSQSVSLSADTIGKQQQDPTLMVDGQLYRNLDQYTQIDVSYRADLPWNGEILLGVSNVMDKIGGKDDSGDPVGAESVDYNQYSIYGRTYSAKLTQRF